MATPRQPWPSAAAQSYYFLEGRAKTIQGIIEAAASLSNHNVYRLQTYLVLIQKRAHDITLECHNLAREADNKWPKWVSGEDGALDRIAKAARHIGSNASSAMMGLDNDNWSKVTNGMSAILDKAQEILMALGDGPKPQISLLDIWQKEQEKEAKIEMEYWKENDNRN